VKRILSLKYLVALIVIIFIQGTYLPFVNEAGAEGEAVKVLQVGTSGGIPAIQASVQNASDTGTYSLVITNPKTNTTFSQNLNSNGKATTFAITNFTENGTYPYTLQVNGIELLEGGVNLVSSKRTPTFAVQASGNDLTIDVTGGVDYVGQTIHFTSGSYSNSVVLSSESMQEAFEGVTGLESTMTFSGETGKLITVDIKKIGATAPAKPQANTNAGTDTKPSTSNNTTTSKPATSSGSNSGTVSSPTKVTGNSSVTTNTNTSSTVEKKITISLNQKTFKLEETLVATVNVVNTDYANKALSLRFGADSNSSTSLISLDENGKGSEQFKISIPQPSSKTISATTYTISGSLLDSTSVSYAISNEVAGQAVDADKSSTGELPYAEYVSLDLTNLEKQKATLAWYDARHIHKYVTKLKVINTTTQDEHTYTVFMPDGDSKIDMNLVYDGPGIYTWELHSGGKLIAQAPYSVAIAVDGAQAVSQNGLPVLKALGNKELYTTHLDGIDPDAVNGAVIGEELGAVTADDVSGQSFEEPFNPEEEQSSSKLIIIIIIILVVIILGVVGLMIYRKRQQEEEEGQQSGFAKYNADEHEENPSKDSDELEEVE